MEDINICLEGNSDKAFLMALFKHHFPQAKSPKIVKMKGDHHRLTNYSEQLKEAKRNLIILDSDVNSQEDVDKTIEPFLQEELAAGRNLRYQCFFVERNLEDLVRAICPENKQDLWRCIDQYADCNLQIDSSDLRRVDAKTKVYTYVNAHNVPNNLKSRTFENPDLWDLNHHEIQPSINFLKTHQL